MCARILAHCISLLSFFSHGVARSSRTPIWPPSVLKSRQGPLPPWNASWRMADSTIVMPCSSYGFLNLSDFEGYGLIDVDWSNAKSVWAAQQPMNCEEALVEQAAAIKAVYPSTRVFVYRNLIKALNWYSSVRYALDNSSFSNWFIKFIPGGSLPNGSWHTPDCDSAYSPPLCTSFYHDLVQTPTPADGCNGRACDCGSTPCGESRPYV